LFKNEEIDYKNEEKTQKTNPLTTIYATDYVFFIRFGTLVVQ